MSYEVLKRGVVENELGYLRKHIEAWQKKKPLSGGTAQHSGG